MAGLFQNPRAWDPMFDDPVVFSGVRNGVAWRRPVKACVLDNGFGDPVDEQSAQGPREIVVTVRGKEWSGSGAPHPKIGDAVTLVDRTAFAVYNVAPFAFGEWTMKARAAK